MKLIGILIVFLFSQVCHAEIYKWTDENGRVHYGERPETENTEKIEIKTSPSSQDPDLAKQRQEKQRKLMEVLEEERQQKNQQRKEELKQKQEIEKECAQLRDYHKTLKQVNLLYDLDDEGNRKYLSEEEHKKEIAEVENYLEKYCK